MNKERRRHVRVTGPFDGCRVGIFDMPLQIHDLSEGGCFLIASHDPPEIGRRFVLRIDLPDEASITVQAETLHVQLEFGYAVRFVDLSKETRRELARLVQKLRERPPERGSRLE